MAITRRELVAAGAATAATAALPGEAVAAAPRSRNPYQMVPLGKTGIKVSLIGFGTGMRGYNRESDLTRKGRAEAVALLQYAYDRGMRLFDCADLYGTHTHVGEALKGKRSKVVINTKVWMHSGGIPGTERPNVDVVVDRFRKELDTDYIDSVLLHCMMSGDWVETLKRQCEILQELKAKKVIRAHGVSVHGMAPLKACVGNSFVNTMNARINAFGDSMDDPNPEAVAEVIGQIRKAGTGVIAMKLIGEGRYRNDDAKRDQSIRFVLERNLADAMIVGFTSREEINDFERRVASALEVVKG